LRLLPCWIHRYKQTALLCSTEFVIVLLLPPRSVIGSLDEVKIWSKVSRLPSGVNKIMLQQGSMGKTRLHLECAVDKHLLCITAG